MISLWTYLLLTNPWARTCSSHGMLVHLQKLRPHRHVPHSRRVCSKDTVSFISHRIVDWGKRQGTVVTHIGHLKKKTRSFQDQYEFYVINFIYWKQIPGSCQAFLSIIWISKYVQCNYSSFYAFYVFIEMPPIIVIRHSVTFINVLHNLVCLKHLCIIAWSRQYYPGYVKLYLVALLWLKEKETFCELEAFNWGRCI